MYELGLELQEGIQDRGGKAIVRRNPGYAFRLLRIAAKGGIEEAFHPLAYAYDVGLGTRANRREALRWYGRAYRRGQSSAATNIAILYRDINHLSAAFRWYGRAAKLNDGDGMVDVGYCYLYGIGIRRDIAAARRLLRRAIASKDITAFGREEAMYHLAVTFIDAGRPALAVPLLQKADEDQDYPEAADALEQIRENKGFKPCRCRRLLRKSLRGHAKCVVHTNRAQSRT